MRIRKTSKRGRLALAALMLALAALGPACAREASPPAFDRETVDRLEETVREVLERDAIPGAIVGAWVPGRGEWTAAVGVADRETGREIATTDLMRVGSVTKSFTATLVLALRDRGLLDLDDPVEKYLPWVPDAGEITVRMLLNHTSGLIDDYADPAFMDKASADPLYRWQPEELARASLGVDAEAVRGETSVYSNVNYVLLGMIAEGASGMEFAEALREYVLAPLGLANTFFAQGPEIAGEHSRSYIVVGEEGELYDMTSGIDPSITWAAGAVVSCLEDLRVWAEALADGRLLEETTQEQRLRWVKMEGSEDAGAGYRYGLGILELGGFVGHNGEFSGYQASVFHLPSRRATVVVLLNCNRNPTGSQDLFTRIAAILFPEEVPEGWRLGAAPP